MVRLADKQDVVRVQEETRKRLRLKAEARAQAELRRSTGEGPTVERMLRGEVGFVVNHVVEKADVVAGTEKETFTGIKAVAPIDRYYARRQISERQYTIALALLQTMRLAGAVPKITKFGDTPGGGDADGFAVARVDALKSIIHAKALVGKQGYDLLELVLWREQDAGTWLEVAYLSPKEASRKGMERLRDTLDKLGG